jgi:hypothetical protein
MRVGNGETADFGVREGSGINAPVLGSKGSTWEEMCSPSDSALSLDYTNKLG